jgi:hypothetical protein
MGLILSIVIPISGWSIILPVMFLLAGWVLVRDNRPAKQEKYSLHYKIGVLSVYQGLISRGQST